MLGRPGAVTVVSYNMHSDWVKDRKPQVPREPNLYIGLPVLVGARAISQGGLLISKLMVHGFF